MAAGVMLTPASFEGQVGITRGRQPGTTTQLKVLLTLNLSALPLLPAVYTVAAAEGIRAALAPTADYFATLGLPSALVRWGHPGASLFKHLFKPKH